MISVTRVDYVVLGTDPDSSRITDLDVFDVSGTPYLITTTRYDGAIRSWAVEAGGLSLIDTHAFAGADQLGGTSTLTGLSLGVDFAVLAGGGTGDQLQTIAVNSNGTLGALTVLSALPATAAGFQHGVTVALGNGTQEVYGGLAGLSGIQRLSFSSAGTYSTQSLFQTPTTGHADKIADLAALTVSGQRFLISANPDQNAVTSWAVDGTGALVQAGHIGSDQGLWIATPTVMEKTSVSGVSYLILGAAGSNSISVMEVGSDGALILRDHVIDTLDTRFAGITSLEIIENAGQTYVLAGGADDGISVFVLLAGGHLVPKTHIADAVDMGLDNISGLAAQSRAGGIDVFAASSSEPGITHLRVDTGTAGTTVTATLLGGLLFGTAGNDILQGQGGADTISAAAGDDILRDGAGSDTLTGGAGADLFLLSRDGAVDVITDFTLGEDKLDLSLFPLLRDISQLTFTIQSYGLDISYGDEQVIVQSADGQFIDYRLLSNSDVLGGMRIGSTIEPGYPGPATPLPDTDPDGPDMESNADFSLKDGISLINKGALSNIQSSLSNTTSQVSIVDDPDQPQMIFGTSGDDVLDGSPEVDVIIGGDGADSLNGGAGGDVLLGRAGNDLLDGGPDGDKLWGGLGDDQLNGGGGNDTLFGGAGADTFLFDGGTDVIADFSQGTDSITLDGSVWTGLTSVADLLFIYGSINGERATIDFENGDILHIDGVTDYATLALDIALF